MNLTFKPKMSAQRSLANFKKAVESGRDTNINTTKKFEDTWKLRKGERDVKAKKELEEKS